MRADMSKTQKRRIFGLTLVQLMILVCLALAAVGTIFGSFILISSPASLGGLPIFPTSFPTFSSQPPNVPGQAGAPGGLATIPPVVSDEQIPSDWKQYSATTIEIWVPPQFEAVDAGIERQRRIESYRGSGFGFLADRLEKDPSDYGLWFNF